MLLLGLPVELFSAERQLHVPLENSILETLRILLQL